MPAKYQYFNYVEKECKQVMKEVLLKKYTSVSRVAKKGLKQAVVLNAMHFYIPTSLCCTTQEQSGTQGDPTGNKHLKRMVILLVGEIVLCC